MRYYKIEVFGETDIFDDEVKLVEMIGHLIKLGVEFKMETTTADRELEAELKRNLN